MCIKVVEFPGFESGPCFVVVLKGVKYKFPIVSEGYASPVTGEILPFSKNPHVTLRQHLAQVSQYL